LVIALSVLQLTASDYPFGISKLISVLSIMVIVLYILQFTAKDYTFGIFKLFSALSVSSLYCLSVNFWLLITLWCLQTLLRSFCFGHCIPCPSTCGF
jgi:hypothetical protein